MLVQLEKIDVEVRKNFWLRDLSLTISSGQQWAFVGRNGSGKSVLGRVLCGLVSVTNGLCLVPENTALVSFERLGDVLQFEREHDDSDFIDRIDHGTCVADFIQADSSQRLKELASRLGCLDLLSRGLRFLSTGEMRKVMILQALMRQPQLLVLDEPFDGLDVTARQALRDLITSWVMQGGQLVLMVNRFSDLLPAMTHLAYLHYGTIVDQGRREAVEGHESVQKLHHLETLDISLFPGCDDDLPPLAGGQDAALISLAHVGIRYGEKEILHDVNWQVFSGEHWKISGPNGAGKSTLLSLISGDNPQAYANEIELFGHRRGSGESVWEIKRHIGLVSALFHQEYRLRVSVQTVVLSGFYDSIGLYQQPTRRQEQIAQQWLTLLHLAEKANLPFRRLSYGEQRLVLLARAMVKQPRVLILDEPCQGLDDVHRSMVLSLIDYLGRQGRTQLLYVTHHEEDRIPCISRHLRLVPSGQGGFTAEIENGSTDL